MDFQIRERALCFIRVHGSSDVILSLFSDDEFWLLPRYFK